MAEVPPIEFECPGRTARRVRQKRLGVGCQILHLLHSLVERGRLVHQGQEDRCRLETVCTRTVHQRTRKGRGDRLVPSAQPLRSRGLHKAPLKNTFTISIRCPPGRKGLVSSLSLDAPDGGHFRGQLCRPAVRLVGVVTMRRSFLPTIRGGPTAWNCFHNRVFRAILARGPGL